MIITAGIYKGRKLTAPSESITRPTLSKTRMGVFNTLYSIIGDFKNKSFLDLFGGSGVMGLEALSRGFQSVKVYEINKKSAEIIKMNYDKLGLKADLEVGDCTKLIEKNEKIYDVIYVDPPYQSDCYRQILPKLNGSIIVIESAAQLDLSMLLPSDFNLIKVKSYGSSIITYASKTQL